MTRVSSPTPVPSATPLSPPLSSSSVGPSPPNLISRPPMRPSFISLPNATANFAAADTCPSPVDSVRSPSGPPRSVSSAEGSVSSRIAAPDLGGSQARYFPMRSVMYPSSQGTGPSHTPITRTSSARSGSTSFSADAAGAKSRDPSLAGPASRAEPPLGGAGESKRVEDEFAPDGCGQAHVERAARGLGMLSRGESSRSRGSGSRPRERDRTSPHTEGGAESPAADSETTHGSKATKQTLSEQPPPSLDDALPEPTTHAKVGDPEQSDEVEVGDDDERQSNVQVHDFIEEDEENREVQKEGGNRIAAEGASTSYTGGSEKPLLMTTRFEHQISDGGEILVLTGREGQLERCEDEPIHCPGAVQAFGVLIVFDLEDSGHMKVKQVSENAGFVLGLPPRFLFRAKCLTQLFDEDEAEALQDAIESLQDRDADETNDEVGPYTFLLSGQGIPGTGDTDAQSRERFEWECHAAIHRPSPASQPDRFVLELELADDQLNPLTTVASESMLPEERGSFLSSEESDNGINPTAEDLLESTVSIVKPLRALTRMREKRRKNGRKGKGLGEVDIVGLLSQINDQLSKAENLETFLKVTAGVFRELTEFDRVMIYQFDEAWNGRVVAEQVDMNKTRDLFRGLNFPASDIPAQARELYRINKVRLLYDRDQPTARLCCRNIDEVDSPLDMTHCHLRAMSPIHIKYLHNMGVRSSMSISITAFGDLWGLVSCHTYGRYGHRISFPVRQLCKLLGQSVSHQLERISVASRLQARKLINTASSEENPGGFIIAKADDLLDLFHADFGILSIGDEAKILGPVSNSQELLAVLEYLRIKQYTDMISSQDIGADFPDIEYPNGFQLIAGMLSIPLSTEGKDFIVFFRRGQQTEVRWAGNPYANKTAPSHENRHLEPRKSFKVWSETVVGKSREWTDEEKETASVLCLVYGKFIAVWREKESALAASQLTNLLLANASHEVRTPLNAIINYLELALDGPIQGEVRENLQRSHTASKSLIHVINDLLDLTRTEKGNDLYLTDPFDLAETLQESLAMHREEAARRGLELELVENPTGTPPTVIGDRAKIRQILVSVVANSLKHTKEGGILVEWGEIVDTNLEDALEWKQDSIRIGISITDTGVGISEEKLENMFRQMENLQTIGDKARDEATNDPDASNQAVGLGLAVVARIVRVIGGQMQVESKVGSGSKFTFIFPFRLPDSPSLGDSMQDTPPTAPASSADGASRTVSDAAARTPMVRRRSGTSTDSHMSKRSNGKSDIDSLMSAMSTTGLSGNSTAAGAKNSSQSRRRLAAGKASSTSSRSTTSATSANSGRSNPSFRTARSNLGSGDVSSADGQTRPGQVGIAGAKIPLRPARMAAPSDGSTDISPMSSPSHLSTKLPTSPSYFSAITASPSPLSQPVPTLRRSSTAAATIGSPGEAFLPSPLPRTEASPPTSESPSTVATAKPGVTPKPSSPQRQDSKKEDLRHISEYRKSPVPDDYIRPMRVLVVEDEKVNRMIISQRLKKDGHEVIVAEHGGVAVRKFEEDRNFDIVLMDLLMPICSGLEASKEIRRVEQEAPAGEAELRPSASLNGGRIPILAVSASLPERDKHTIIDAELNGWLLKPIDFKRLKALMKGATDVELRAKDVYRPGQWERGGWLTTAPSLMRSASKQERPASKQQRSHSQMSADSAVAMSPISEPADA
ncbi:hypothetical protein JCM11641_000177 [Rhodosporidiobolus odoratus]